jgi:dTMP kinase
MSRGKLIVLEGVDGSGKSTQVKLIQDYFNEENLKFAYYHFPMYGHNQFSDMVARFLRGEFGNVDEVDPLFVANIYAMDRFRFLPELEKSIEENDVVLLDRYVYSNIAYQCGKFKNAEDAVRMKDWIFDFEFNFLGLPYPDLNLFLDVPIEVTKARLEAARNGNDREYLQGKQDIHEADLEFQIRVRDNYLLSMEGAINCRIVDCAKAMDNGEWSVLAPEPLFKSYLKYLDFVLFNTPIE